MIFSTQEGSCRWSRASSPAIAKCHGYYEDGLFLFLFSNFETLMQRHAPKLVARLGAKVRSNDTKPARYAIPYLLVKAFNRNINMGLPKRYAIDVSWRKKRSSMLDQKSWKLYVDRPSVCRL